MEYRNIYNTPREMVSDDTLAELLRENEPQVYEKDLREMEGRIGYGRQNPPEPEKPELPNCRGEYPYVRAMETNRDLDKPRPTGHPLAMVYSPEQEWEELYDVEDAICRGTLFKKLDLPFYPGCCVR